MGVAERGPELVNITPGGRGAGQRVELVVRGGQTEFDRFMAAWIRRFVRVKGRGSVQTAFGR